MLSGIHPVLGGRLLAGLDQLGHGDEIVVADANFPAYRVGTNVIDVVGVSAAEVVHAIRTVVPLDTHEGAAVLLMSAGGDERLAVQQELIDAAQAPEDRVDELDRFDFYARAASAALVVRTGEMRAYGNLIVRKGVVNDYTPSGVAQ